MASRTPLLPFIQQQRRKSSLTFTIFLAFISILSLVGNLRRNDDNDAAAEVTGDIEQCSDGGVDDFDAAPGKPGPLGNESNVLRGDLELFVGDSGLFVEDFGLSSEGSMSHLRSSAPVSFVSPISNPLFKLFASSHSSTSISVLASNSGKYCNSANENFTHRSHIFDPPCLCLLPSPILHSSSLLHPISSTSISIVASNSGKYCNSANENFSHLG
nr:hypothetical protein Iba_chr01fCG7870 [Ipomoea batatas]